jgi:uncharacterized membrane protein
MAFCGKCGSSLAEGVAFCPHCGAPVGAAVPPPPPAAEGSSAPPPPPPFPPGPPGAGWAPAPGVPVVPASGMQENLAGCLCYALGWLTGIIFLLIDRRPFVRFHAAQSIVVFGALSIVRVILLFGFFGGPYYGFFSFVGLLSLLVSVVTLIAWLMLMVFAYQGRRYEVPVAAGIAKSIAGDPTV